MELGIGISEKHKESVVEILTRLLADECILYTKTRNYHWNVVGPQFHDYHQFFESRYKEQNEIVDDVAERIRALGRQSIGTLAEFIRFTRLGEHPDEYPRAPGMIANLLTDYEKIIRQLRSDVDLRMDEYHDTGTSDFLTGLKEQHEKTAWMLRAMLESKIEGSI